MEEIKQELIDRVKEICDSDSDCKCDDYERAVDESGLTDRQKGKLDGFSICWNSKDGDYEGTEYRDELISAIGYV